MSILFVCTDNASRSQIAEGWAMALSGGHLVVKSAGLISTAVQPVAIQAMDEVGIDLRAQESTAVTADDFESADIIVTVCEQADRRCPPLPAGKIKYFWPIKSPIKKSEHGQQADIEAFRHCRDEIRTRIIRLFQMEGIAYSDACYADREEVAETVKEGAV